MPAYDYNRNATEDQQDPKVSQKRAAFLLGISGDLAFAAGNVALSINKYCTIPDYDILVFHMEMPPSDEASLGRIPNVKLIPFTFPETFVKHMLEKLPQQSRFRDKNRLMCFAHFEAFKLLEVYRSVAWLDVDIAVQSDVAPMSEFLPFGITLDTPWTVQNNFTQAIAGYQMTLPGVCTAVMIVGDALPFAEIYDWCIAAAMRWAEYLVNPDQAIINLALQEFGLQAKMMPLEIWQCIAWKDEAIEAKIVHFGTDRKVWNASNVCSAFPEWYRTHLQWLAIGGSDFTRTNLEIRNALPGLDDLEQRKKEAPPEPPIPRSLGVSRLVRGVLRRGYLGLGLHTAQEGTLLHKIHQTIYRAHNKYSRPSERPVSVSLTFLAVPVAFRVTGGIGDHIIAARYIRDLITAAGDFRFDIYSSRPESAEWIFGKFYQLNSVYNEHLEWGRHYAAYNLAVWIQTFAIIQYDSVDWRSLFRQHKKLARICEHLDRSRSSIEHHVSRHPRSDNALAQEAVVRGQNRYDLLHALSGIKYGGDTFDLEYDPSALLEFGLSGVSYLTVHNGSDDALWIDGHFMANRHSTKAYPHFAELIKLIKEAFPELYIVQVGTSTSRPIPGVDACLLNKTNMPKTTAIIRHSQLHIDNESGLVHIAASFSVRSCVLFGPTSLPFFAYDGNINIPPAACGNCWWTTPDWMRSCPRGLDQPICLAQTTPQSVFDAIRPSLVEIVDGLAPRHANTAHAHSQYL